MATVKTSLLASNIAFYMNGQSVIPPMNMFKKGYFDFVNGEVTATKKALDIYAQVKKNPMKIIISSVAINRHSSTSIDVIEVKGMFDDKEETVHFGGGQAYYYRRNDESEGSFNAKLMASYADFAYKVLTFILNTGYDKNLKKSTCVSQYIQRYKDNRFTWLKWLLNELKITNYQFVDKHLYKTEKSAEAKKLELYRSLLTNNKFALMMTPPILHKYFPKVDTFLSVGEQNASNVQESKDGCEFGKYNLANPGASLWYPKELFGKKKTNDADVYEDDNGKSGCPFYSLIEDNMITIQKGEIKFNENTTKYVAEWEENFKNIIIERVGDWRQSYYQFQHNAYDPYDNDYDNMYNVKWEIPGLRFSLLQILDSAKNHAHCYILKLCNDLGVSDKLYQGLAAVTHPRQMMDILTHCLKNNNEMEDELTKIKYTSRDSVSGVLNHLDKHMAQ